MNEEKKKNKYIADEIGEAYKEWNPGQIIKISAPTGSGKSSFIFHQLLPFAIQKGWLILYLVNRKVLKKQLEEELNDKILAEIHKEYNFIDSLNSFIHIETYQTIENLFLYDTNNLSQFHHYNIVVYDECHYFYSDANFNTNTIVSFNLLRRLFHEKLQIYMSATMENMNNYIDKMEPYYNALWWETYPHARAKQEGKERIVEYKLDPDYSHVEIYSFDNDNTLAEIIKTYDEKDEKWLIFIDNIAHGNSLKKELEKSFKNQIIFIDAKFSQDPDAKDAVQQLTEDNLVHTKIIITTSVLDNGISIKDSNLRSIVLFCDTEEQFIQMLGRKRNDGQKINLYICKYDKLHFVNRMHYMKGICDFYQKNYFYIQEMQRHHLLVNNQLVGSFFAEPTFDLFIRSKPWLTPSITNQNNLQYNMYQDYNHKLSLQQNLLSQILNNKSFYNNAKGILFSVNGFLALNQFSIDRCINLKEYYKQIAHALEQDDKAFLKIQAGWLSTDINKIHDATKREEEIHRESLKNALERLFSNTNEIELTKEENIKLKMDIRDHLRYFCKDDIEKKIVHRNDSPLAPSHFNNCMNMASLPYYMTKKGKDPYIITKK